MKKGKNVNRSKKWMILERLIFNFRYSMFLIPFALSFIFPACDLPNEPGPMPTDIIDTEFEPGLNILGVLRLDDTIGTSFLRFERAYQIEETDIEQGEHFSPVVSNAEVSVQGTVDTTTYVFSFEEDSVRGDIYVHHDFNPMEGEQYFLTITSEGLSELTASTIVPVRPSIDSTSLEISDRDLSFDLLTTGDTDLYDIYLFLTDGALHQRVVNRNEERISITFNFSSDRGQPVLLEIYGYDTNLSEYLLASIIIKPQTYQETVTTVSGGYGCFGSVSKKTILLNSR